MLLRVQAAQRGHRAGRKRRDRGQADAARRALDARSAIESRTSASRSSRAASRSSSIEQKLPSRAGRREHPPAGVGDRRGRTGIVVKSFKSEKPIEAAREVHASSRSRSTDGGPASTASTSSCWSSRTCRASRECVNERSVATKRLRSREALRDAEHDGRIHAQHLLRTRQRTVARRWPTEGGRVNDEPQLPRCPDPTPDGCGRHRAAVHPIGAVTAAPPRLRSTRECERRRRSAITAALIVIVGVVIALRSPALYSMRLLSRLMSRRRGRPPPLSSTTVSTSLKQRRTSNHGARSPFADEGKVEASSRSATTPSQQVPPERRRQRDPFDHDDHRRAAGRSGPIPMPPPMRADPRAGRDRSRRARRMIQSSPAAAPRR